MTNSVILLGDANLNDEPLECSSDIAEELVLPQSVPGPSYLDVIAREVNCSANQAKGGIKPLKKKRTRASSVQDMQIAVLQLEQEKLKIEIDNANIVNKKLKLELQHMENGLI